MKCDGCSATVEYLDIRKTTVKRRNRYPLCSFSLSSSTDNFYREFRLVHKSKQDLFFSRKPIVIRQLDCSSRERLIFHLQEYGCNIIVSNIQKEDVIAIENYLKQDFAEINSRKEQRAPAKRILASSPSHEPPLYKGKYNVVKSLPKKYSNQILSTTESKSNDQNDHSADSLINSIHAQRNEKLKNTFPE